MNTTLSLFRKTALAEGISMVILVLIAMPLKYLTALTWGPLAVKYVGWAHGLLFIAYVILLLLCWDTYKWSFKRIVIFFLASLIPFAPFFVERQLKEETTAEPVRQK